MHSNCGKTAMEITSEPMVPLLKNAVLALHTCCKLHYPNCAACQLVKNIKFGEQGIPLCRCEGYPAKWCAEEIIKEEEL